MASNIEIDLGPLKELDASTPPGEPSLLVEIIDAYLEESVVDEGSLRNAVASQDLKALASAAHRLKGSSANVGVKSLVGVCADLERDARAGSVPDMAGRVDGLLDLLEQCRAVLRAERVAAL